MPKEENETGIKLMTDASLIVYTLFFSVLGYFIYDQSLTGLFFVMAFVLALNIALFLSIFGLPGYIIGIIIFKWFVVPQLMLWSHLPESIVTSVAFWLFAIIWGIYAFFFTLGWFAILFETLNR